MKTAVRGDRVHHADALATDQIVPSDSRETTDGGKTWHFYASDYQQAAPVAPQIVFGDANVGYATARGAIQRTIDGGAHLTSIKTPGT